MVSAILYFYNSPIQPLHDKSTQGAYSTMTILRNLQCPQEWEEKKEKNSCTFSVLVEQCLYRCPVSPPSSQAVGHWLYTGLLQPQLAKLGCQSYDKYRQLPRISVNFFRWTNYSDTCLCYKVINTQLYNNKFQELQELLVLQRDQILFYFFKKY